MIAATSLNALESIEPRLPRVRGIVFNAIRSIPSGLTDEEAAAITGLSLNTIRPRRSELRAAGLIVDSGRTRPTKSGCEATIWRLATAEEREAFEAGRAERELNDLAQAADEAWAKYDAIRERYFKACNARRAEVSP